MHLPTLDTPRLTIRPYTPADLDARHALMAETFGSTDALEDTRRWLAWTVAAYRELARLYQPPYGDYAVILRQTGETIGTVGLVPALIPWDALTADPARRNTFTQPEFGLFWAVRTAHRGRGYAVEAARPIIAHVFTALNGRRVIAQTEYDNHASQRVMVKLGMTLHRNPGSDPPWLEVVGVLANPAAG
jgi:ribosomal-protein-alanine N-acetyltransferase